MKINKVIKRHFGDENRGLVFYVDYIEWGIDSIVKEEDYKSYFTVYDTTIGGSSLVVLSLQQLKQLKRAIEYAIKESEIVINRKGDA